MLFFVVVVYFERRRNLETVEHGGVKIAGDWNYHYEGEHID